MSEPKDISTSVRRRLFKRARERGEDFQIVLTYYAIERLLYRLSRTRHAERFVLKGAMLFSTWLHAPHRPTRDLDLLGKGDPSASGLNTARSPRGQAATVEPAILSLTCVVLIASNSLMLTIVNAVVEPSSFAKQPTSSGSSH